MGIMRNTLLCIGIVLCMESAYAGVGCGVRATYSRGSVGLKLRCEVSKPSWWGKRSVDTPESEAKDREMIESMQNHATIADFITAVDANNDGCVDAAEWMKHGRVSEFFALDSYDANGDDCLSEDEIKAVPLKVDVEEVVAMPVKEYDDMKQKIEGKANA